MATVGMKISKKGISYERWGLISVENNSPCVDFQAQANTNGESLERRNKCWFVKANAVSDFTIQVGEDSFHLNKLPMVSRSGYINRLVLQSKAGNSPSIKIDNLPGGAKMFVLVVKFSYGMKINLTAANIAPLHCAANFLEMSDDLEPGNLISITEAFMSYVILSSWKGTFQILKSCESITSWAKDLQIIRECVESIAWKICTEKKSSDLANDELFLNVAEDKELPEDWWFEDVSFLRMDHFIGVIAAIKRKKIKPELVGSCIAHRTRKWLSQITITNKNLNHKSLAIRLHRATAESIIRILPAEANAISCNFLLHLFKIGLILQVNSGLLNQLERKIAIALESCRATDLLIRNSVTLFDVDIVTKVVQTYASYASSNPHSKMSAVGRLVDDYLELVARDVNLPATTFQLLVEALPRNARPCNDNLYRAIDMYLKAHPNMTEDERNNICRAIDYYKLSHEARKHATRNDRLPINMAAQFILLEQVSITRTLTAPGSNYQRNKSQAILRVNKGLEKEWINSSNEIEMMKKDVERLKIQLGELQFCRLELQKQMGKTFCI